MLATSRLEARPCDDSIVELSLMMARGQFDAMEQQAQTRGMSVAQFLRRLVQQSLDRDATERYYE